MNRIPLLDGLRALAILLVLVGHHAFGRQYDDHYWLFIGNAKLGVTIFFVLSGFLITSLLLREWENTAKVSLGRFYIRRSLRIFPAFYAYLILIGVATGLGWLAVSATDFVFAGSYLWNYSCRQMWALDHLWSLSVEEHFYLLWPACFWLLMRRGGRPAALIGAIVVIALSPILRVVAKLLTGGAWSSLELTHLRLDGLMFGCALALAWEHPWGLRVRGAVNAKLATLAVAVAFVLLPALQIMAEVSRLGTALLITSYYLLESMAVTVLLAWLLQHPGTLPSRVLSIPVLRWIGVLSYSLYLWQTVWLDQRNGFAQSVYPLNLLLLAGCAIGSYFLIERPFLSWRDRKPIPQV